MSNITTIVGDVITKVNEHTNHIDTHISVPTSYHIYNGSVEATNTILTNGFGTTLYTGNGSTQSINTGVDMDTQWGNDASEKFGGLVWIKGRSGAINHMLEDTIRGIGYNLSTDLTSAQGYAANLLTAFTTTGYNIGNSVNINTSSATYVSWNFQTTHRVTGTTNHGKAYTCHYNPFTGFTMVKYEGSGLAGHEIPHSLGRKLGFATVKCISTINDWFASYLDSFGTQRLKLNSADASTTETTVFSNNTNDNVIISTSNASNGTGNYYIMYGWANSYFDEDNTLIGNYEIGVYQGTGASGNKVTTRGKPAWVKIKRLDSNGDWVIFDNKRTPDQFLSANASTTEIDFSGKHSLFEENGFTFDADAGWINASSGQYLYMVVYDNDSGSGKSKYPKATDTTNLSINALVPYANGIDVNGSKVSIEHKNETITGLTLTQGKNYVYSKNDGTYGVSKYEPMYGSLRNRNVAGENPDYFDLKTMKWYGTTGGSNLFPNPTFEVVADGEIGHDNGNGTVDGYENLLGGTASIYNGRLKVSGNQWATARIQLSGLVAGKRYKIVIGTNEKGTATSPYVELNSDNDAKIIINERNYSEFIPNGTTKYIRFVATATAESGVYAYFDNISLFEVEPTIGAEITPRTYLDCIVHADHNGQVSYVEELPKIEYKDIIKANEFKGKNACTAWVNFDGTTTPPTIRDSFNVSSVVRTATGDFSIYFGVPMNNTNYNWIPSVNKPDIETYCTCGNTKTTTYCTIVARGVVNYISGYNGTEMSVQIFGGKN